MSKKAPTLEELDAAIVEAIRTRNSMPMGGVRRLFGAHAEKRVQFLVQQGLLFVDIDMYVHIR